MEAAPGRPFRADVEGLRAVAVVAVVLFHAAVPDVAGGFVGVDVFFVISGFLITGMLWREAGRGRIRLAAFYGGRARRLLPAAVLVVVVTAAVATAVLPPLQVRGVLGDAVASALYVGNYRLAVEGTDYLAADSPPSPFQHYWSLGVEEQFYLLWPALLVLAAWAGARLLRRSSAVAPAVVLAVVAAGSFAVSLLWTTTTPPWAYFALPSRAWELAAGGLVALGVPLWRRVPGAAAAVAGWAGLAVVVGSCVLLGPRTPFPGTAALAPVLGAALVVLAGCAGSRGGPGALLALPPLRWTGRLSYSWYLWHWPVLVLAPALLGHALGLPARLIAAAVSGALALATLYLVENPVRFAAPLRRSPGRSLALGGSVTAVGVCAALLAGALAPGTSGHGRAVAAPRLRAPTAPATRSVDPAAQQVQALTAQVQAAVSASAGLQAVPSNLTPPLASASSDDALPFHDGCDQAFTTAIQPPCVFGDSSGSAAVALVGDSHAAAWYPAVQPWAAQRQERLDVLAKATCPFLLDLPENSPYLGRRFTECDQWRTAVLARLRADRPALVVLAMSRRYGSDFGFTSYDPSWLAALGRTVSALRSLGATVLVLGPVPDPHGWVPTCLSAHLDAASTCAPARSVAVDAAGVAAEAAAVQQAGGRYADLTDLFCTSAVCPVVVGNTLVFRDDNHITPEYATVLAPVIGALLTQALGGG